MIVEKVTITSNDKIAKDTFKMTLEGSHDLVTKMRAGQFVNIQIEGLFLRRPISISDIIDRQNFAIVYKVVGAGTDKLSTLKEGDKLDVFGPLGNGYTIDEGVDEVLLIGGGVGVPPLLQLAKKYRKLRADVYVAMGFNSKEEVFYKKEFEDIGCNVVVATMDGSEGTKGTVIDAITESNITTDFVCACGPVPMLKAVEERYTRGFMSFEARMACGMGACLACVAKDKKEADMYHKICKDGPVFPIGKVVY